MDRCAGEARNTAGRRCAPSSPRSCSQRDRASRPLAAAPRPRWQPRRTLFSRWRGACLVALLVPLALGLGVAAPAKAAADVTVAADAINAFRQQNGRPPLRLNAQLSQAAQGWSSSMAQSGSMVHGDFGARIAAAGYRACGGVENIGQGSGLTGSQIAQLWINSPPHRDNLLNAQVTEMGLGSSQAANNTAYWTFDAAAPCGGSPAVVAPTPVPIVQPTPTLVPRVLSSNLSPSTAANSTSAGTVTNSTSPNVTANSGVQTTTSGAVVRAAAALPDTPAPTASPTATPTPSLTARKSCTPGTATVGQSVACVVTVTNAGPGAALNVTISDALPVNTTFLSAAASQGTCTGTSPVTCTLGSLGGGGTATATVTFVPTAVAAGTILTDTATVAGTGLAAQVATATVTVARAATLTITKTGAPNPVSVGQPLTYTLMVTNPASTAATGVTVADTLPGNVTFVSATSSVGTCSGTTTVTCNVGALAAGANATIAITVIPNPGTAGGAVTNSATAAAAGIATPVTATVTTQVSAQVPIIPPTNLVPPNLPNLSAQPLLPPPPPIVLPSPPPPQLIPLQPGPATMPRPAFPEVPVIPEADAWQLLLVGLAAVGGIGAYRRFRWR